MILVVLLCLGLFADCVTFDYLVFLDLIYFGWFGLLLLDFTCCFMLVLLLCWECLGVD